MHRWSFILLAEEGKRYDYAYLAPYWNIYICSSLWTGNGVAWQVHPEYDLLADPLALPGATL